MSILVVGSVAFDAVKTPFGERDRILGGSATYFSVAASFFTNVRVVAVVGDDFPDAHVNLLESHGIVWSLQAPPDAEDVKLSPVERRQLYLVFKEALHNAAQHSAASSVSMSLAVKGSRLTAKIRDDGRGFDEPAEGDTRHGLGSMSARAADLGGKLTIESASGRGTEVRLEVPLSGRNA